MEEKRGKDEREKGGRNAYPIHEPRGCGVRSRGWRGEMEENRKLLGETGAETETGHFDKGIPHLWGEGIPGSKGKDSENFLGREDGAS